MSQKDRAIVPVSQHPMAYTGVQEKITGVPLQYSMIVSGKRMRQLLGNPPWACDRALDSLQGRLTAHDLIDRHLSAWTRRRSAHVAMNELAAWGIPAGAVQSSKDLANDAQYAYRKFHRVHHHPEMGTVPYTGTQFRIAGYESGPYACAPMFGEHNYQVLTEIVGLSEDEVAELISQSAVR
jgi:crotonobetainyl-CoA:carnitine CoA-transferase CaiB-like acyl-CoA transferase